VSNEFDITFGDAEAIICLCRPDMGNMLSLDGLRKLTAAIDGLAGHQRTLKVLRIRAHGAAFCMGRQPPPAGAPKGGSSAVLRRRLIDPILDLYRAIRAWDMPVIAQVQGEAAGLGCALVAACDLAVAAQSARFSLPEMDKGLPPTLALSALSRKVHAKAAASMVWGLAKFDAHTAQAIGLVGETAVDEQLAARVDDIVAQIVRQHPLGLATLKRYTRSVHTADFDSSAELAGVLLSSALSSIEAERDQRAAGRELAQS